MIICEVVSVVLVVPRALRYHHAHIRGPIAPLSRSHSGTMVISEVHGMYQNPSNDPGTYYIAMSTVQTMDFQIAILCRLSPFKFGGKCIDISSSTSSQRIFN